MDWTGNQKTAFVCNGARNYSVEERETNDYYATDPKAIDILINDAGITFSSEILEIYPHFIRLRCGDEEMSLNKGDIITIKCGNGEYEED